MSFDPRNGRKWPVLEPNGAQRAGSGIKVNTKCVLENRTDTEK